MILFLDTSVLLAASGSATGASRFVCANANAHDWQLTSSGYCVEETTRNLPKVGGTAPAIWKSEIRPALDVVPDALSIGDRALVFSKAKDRPVVISALAAEASFLLTLDRADFHGAIGSQIYGMQIRTPADFLIGLRKAGLI